MMTIEEVCKIRDLHNGGFQVDAGVTIRDLTTSHVEALVALNEIKHAIAEDGPGTQGVWIAYPSPTSAVSITRKSVAPVNQALGVVVFTDEVAALRFANEAPTPYRVVEVEYGQTIATALSEQEKVAGPA